MQRKFLTDPILRYNIYARLDAMSRSEALEIRRFILETTKVVPSTYHRWLAIKKEDSSDIPGLALRLFAQKFKTRIELLFNP